MPLQCVQMPAVKDCYISPAMAALNNLQLSNQVTGLSYKALYCQRKRQKKVNWQCHNAKYVADAIT